MTRVIAKLRSLVRDVVRGPRVDREIDEELRFHLDEAIDAGLSEGLSLEDARRSAYESLGGIPSRIRDEVREGRGISLVDDFWRDLGYGARLLRRNTGFACVVLATIAIASGAVVTVFSIADAWLFRPLSFPAADRLV